MSWELVLVGGRPLRLARVRCERGSVVVVSPAGLPVTGEEQRGFGMRRCIGLDVHRDFAQVAIWKNGGVVDAGRVATSPEGLRAFAATLSVDDEVAWRPR